MNLPHHALKIASMFVCSLTLLILAVPATAMPVMQAGAAFPDTIGACCFREAPCQILGPRGCADLGGSYDGDGTVCEGNPCTFGACCFGDGSCLVILESACAGQEGTFHSGIECDVAQCPPAQACCFSDGGCAILTDEACAAAGGTPKPPGTVCEATTCAFPGMGACCIGHEPAVCQILNVEDCEIAHGLYLGDLTVCSPDPCPFTATRPSTWGRLRLLYR